MQKHTEKTLFNIHILSFYFWCTFMTLLLSCMIQQGWGQDDRLMSHESHLIANKTFIPIEIN